MSNEDLNKNLTLYPWYQASTGFLPWLPIFFLYFYQQLSLSTVLQISAVYYFAVFVLEVPSGYFSDLFGRKLTLTLSAIFALVSYTLFITGNSFTAFAIGQIFMAGCVSFKSGSDNALLYDSLKTLKRESEYAQREANGFRWNMISLAIAALLGGISGTFNLTIPYYLAFLGALVALYISTQFSEPEQQAKASSFFQQLSLCLSRLKVPVLCWLFAFYVLSFAMAHIPYEFIQPYILLLDIGTLSGADSTALVSGVVIALSMLGGALGATISIHLLERIGLQTLLFTSLFVILIIIGGMSLALHPALLVLVLFRNLPMALSDAPVLAAVAPHIESSYRATYLSLQSLAGRLGFAILLYSLSTLLGGDTGTDAMQWPELRSFLFSALFVGIVGVVLLKLLYSRSMGGREKQTL